jgi:hypothetical protein
MDGRLVTRHSSGQIVYRGTPGTVCKSRKIQNIILSLLVQEPIIEKVSKYGIGKWYSGLVFANICNSFVGNTKTTERGGGGGESVVYELKQFYTF